MAKNTSELVNSFKNILEDEFGESKTLEAENDELRKEVNQLRKATEEIKKNQDDFINENTLSDNIQNNTNEIIILKEKTQKNIWLIGQRLNHILENKLYLNIVNEDNNPKYKNFADYVNCELDFQERTAFNYISIFKNFELQPVAVVDYSKLLIVSKISDKNKRQQLITEIIEDKLSKKEVENKVRQIKELEPQNKINTPKQIKIQKDKSILPIYFETTEDNNTKTITIKIPSKNYENYEKIIEFLNKLANSTV